MLRIVNPFRTQRPWLRVRARPRLIAFGAAANLVLVDAAGQLQIKPDGAAAGADHSVTRTDDPDPTGAETLSCSVRERTALL